MTSEQMFYQAAHLRRAAAMGEEASLLLRCAAQTGEAEFRDRAINLMDDLTAILFTVGGDLHEAGI